MHYYKPRGLIVHRFLDKRSTAIHGWAIYHYTTTIRSVGRTGAAVRSWFARQTPEKQQNILANWHKGYHSHA